ncbi:uncharacterized protein [Lolium perenne]|uniref:uncharacterized protein isoform X1 n=1 Tax=Lolium perenne TaxID=4522 RepID=UPI0021F598DF|nr:uncharacterized protein LOC127343113 isoform X2 [Lolium perenne]XP_051225163.1 uncharacterized protein LOC127343113 isoform X2 [Lolium perenne]XP_051225164.1 uncharacterized protein LOC127343113 isoform X2 [Lolium perenne]
MPPVQALLQSRTQGRRDGVDVAQEGVGGAAELWAGGGEADHGAAERSHALPQSRTQGRRDGGLALEARVDVAQEGVGGAAELRSGGGEAEHGAARTPIRGWIPSSCSPLLPLPAVLLALLLGAVRGSSGPEVEQKRAAMGVALGGEEQKSSSPPTVRMEAYTAAGSGPLPPALSFFIVHGGKRSEATEADQATSLRHWAGEAQTMLRHAVELVAAKCCGRAEQLADSGSSIASGSNCRHALSRRWEERDSTQQEDEEGEGGAWIGHAAAALVAFDLSLPEDAATLPLLLNCQLMSGLQCKSGFFFLQRKILLQSSRVPWVSSTYYYWALCAKPNREFPWYLHGVESLIKTRALRSSVLGPTGPETCSPAACYHIPHQYIGHNQIISSGFFLMQPEQLGFRQCVSLRFKG